MTATVVRPGGAPAPVPPPARPVVPAPPVVPGGGLPAQPQRFSLLDVGHLPRAVRESRHRMLIAILAIHVPLVLLLGIDRHRGAATSAELMLPVLVAVLGARFLGDRLLRSASVVVGLCWCSYAVVYLSGGSPEAHLHPLLVLVLVALYQDPALLLAAVVALAAMLAVPAAVQPSLVYAPGAALRRPWAWTGVHVLAMVGVAAASAFSWRRDVPVPVFADPAPVEADPEPAPEVAEHIERARAAELALARRQATYALMTNLARRNQSLVGRQLSTLDDLERDERDPDVLAGLFALDHLATRMRRNAENLLVLAGASGATSRSFSQPVPVEELLRGAAAEVEQYARVDVNVGAEAAVAGHAVSDVAHLLAELLDNALACSPPDTQVVVGAAPGTDGGLRLWVADEGIGMTANRLAEHNAMLCDADDQLEVGATLGFPVVKRLAARHAIRVVLGSREGGQPGLVAYVDLPDDIVRSEVAVPAASVVAPSGAAGAALPGRRAARRVSEDAGKQRRNELALDAAAENWFHPAPMPTDVEEDEAATWGEQAGAPGFEVAAAEPVPAVEPADVAAPALTDLPVREAGSSPLAARTPGEGLPQRPTTPPPSAVADEAPTAQLDVAALRATLAAETPEPVAEVTPAATVAEATPSYDDILFGDAPPPSFDELAAPTRAETVVPAQGVRGGLARRVPQQALREAGGTVPAPQVFQPGPTFGAAPGGDVDPDERPEPVDPARSSDVLASYRAGLARARAGASPTTDTPVPNGEQP